MVFAARSFDPESFKRGEEAARHNIAQADSYSLQSRTFHKDGWSLARAWGDIGYVAIDSSFDVLSIEKVEELKGRISAVVEFAVQQALEHAGDPSAFVRLKESAPDA